MKDIASKILLQPDEMYRKEELTQWYEYIMDIIDTKLYRPPIEGMKNKPRNVCVVLYENKGLDDINLPKIFNDPGIIQSLPAELKMEEQNPVVTYKLGQTIRNKVFNYKETIENINDKEKDILECECKSSILCNNDIGHIITGNLAIVENSKLRKLLTKGPNYREPKCLNYTKCVNEISKALDKFSVSMAKKHKLLQSTFDVWRNNVLRFVNKKVERLKIFKHPKKTNPLLRDSKIVMDLKILQNKCVIVPIDKAANNIAFICKRYYIQRLLSEVGIIGVTSDTYKVSNYEKESIILNNIIICEKLGLKLEEENKKLPCMYWIPKMHKKPVGARFIVASKMCTTKPLSKAISKVFKLIINQINNFHKKRKFYTNINLFWVVNNSYPIKEKLDHINSRKKAKSISTYDFSTLYTKIPHNELIKELGNIIDLVFEGGKGKYIDISKSKAFWCKTKNGKTSVSKTGLKILISHLIKESYFQIGNKILIQAIGIPMGLDPAPFWANLYLHRYEYIYMSSLIKNDISRAYGYHGCRRFIDDLVCVNDGEEFANTKHLIYPGELQLNCEHTGTHATFLDLDIKIENGMFIYKMFDKRNSFPFHIVRMPHKSSACPMYIFYGSIMSEFLRIARVTLRLIDFIPPVASLVKRMIKQGGDQNKIFGQLNKAITRHPDAFKLYKINQARLIEEIQNYIQ